VFVVGVCAIEPAFSAKYPCQGKITPKQTISESCLEMVNGFLGIALGLIYLAKNEESRPQTNPEDSMMLVRWRRNPMEKLSKCLPQWETTIYGAPALQRAGIKKKKAECLHVLNKILPHPPQLLRNKTQCAGIR